jgi:hypothetical protein
MQQAMANGIAFWVLGLMARLPFAMATTICNWYAGWWAA